MKLPNYEKAIVAEAKIVRYLLDLSHPVGRSKAEFYLRFGFRIEDWIVMADALRKHAAEHLVTNTEASNEGIRYVIEGSLRTPDERDPFIRSIWFIAHDDDTPKFVSAYPVKKRSR